MNIFNIFTQEAFSSSTPLIWLSIGNSILKRKLQFTSPGLTLSKFSAQNFIDRPKIWIELK